jgi:hypothetical protein
MLKMTDNYIPPTKNAKSFHCPLCGVLAHQTWDPLYLLLAGGLNSTDLSSSKCAHCQNRVWWFQERMIVPGTGAMPSPHHDLPPDCSADYNEAREIAGRSPRGASALLRLVIQKLMPVLGESGENINDDIKSLVQKGLPPKVQKALDYCRVVGNNAVHPGAMDVADDAGVVASLAAMINFIVEDQISRPKQIEALYQGLPAGALKAIEKRDK